MAPVKRTHAAGSPVRGKLSNGSKRHKNSATLDSCEGGSPVASDDDSEDGSIDGELTGAEWQNYEAS